MQGGALYFYALSVTRQGVFVTVLVEVLQKSGVTGGFDFVEVAVRLKHGVFGLDDADGDIGAVVRDTLVIAEDIGQDKEIGRASCRERV